MSREPREFWIVESATGTRRETLTREDLAEAKRIVNDEEYPALAPWTVIPCVEIVK